MRPAPPIVEDRTLPGIRRLDPGQDPVAELAREVRSRLGLADDAGLGPGDALSAIAWRLAEIAIARVNGIPERNLLAFLELIGVRRLPPQAARTALSFALAPGASGRPLLPAGVQVAGSPLGDETEPVVFETDDPLVLTPRVKTAVIVHQPDADRWSDRGLGEGDEPFAAFGGADPIAHDLYVTHPMLGAPGQKSIELRAATSDMASLGNLPLRVAEWDGTEWRKLSHRASTPGPGVAALSVAHADAPAPVEVDGLTAPWLRVRLNTPLPASTSADGATDRVERSGLAPDAIAVGSAPARVDAVIDAFGRA
ncbi:MAG TPA: hypothetical protein VGO64_06920, partial [Candidatus Limnocylindrales bacterium]|nr:hypothetical protein [Candidatus Limnocylindrales bacterium]